MNIYKAAMCRAKLNKTWNILYLRPVKTCIDLDTMPQISSGVKPGSKLLQSSSERNPVLHSSWDGMGKYFIFDFINAELSSFTPQPHSLLRVASVLPNLVLLSKRHSLARILTWYLVLLSKDWEKAK